VINTKPCNKQNHMNKYGGGNNTQSRDNLLIFFENYKRVLDSLNKEEATIKQKNIDH